MEIEKLVLTGQRKHQSGTLAEEENNGTKIPKTLTQPPVLRMSASLMSSLITLDAYQMQVNDNIIFKKRAFRLLTKNREFTFPETSENCTKEKLSFLLQHYSESSKSPRNKSFTQGGLKKEDYSAFLCNIIRYHSLDSTSEKIIIFADNASVHHAKYVKECFEGKLTFLFNAAYSRMLNPIEDFFSKFKASILNQSCQTDQKLYNAFKYSLDNFTAADFKGYMRHLLKFAEKSLNDEDLC